MHAGRGCPPGVHGPHETNVADIPNRIGLPRWIRQTYNLTMAIDLLAARAAAKLRHHHAALVSEIVTTARDTRLRSERRVIERIEQRIREINSAVALSLAESEQDADRASSLLGDWIRNKAPIRLIGVGAGLAALAIPAHRLASAGARVSFDGGLIGSPHPLRGGSIIAVSLSEGDEATIAETTRAALETNRELQVIALGRLAADALTGAGHVRLPLVWSPTGDEWCLPHVASGILDALILHALDPATGAASR